MVKAENNDVAINVRIQTSQRSLIDRAAIVVGKSCSEFMLESACEKAKDVILEQNCFQLDSEQYEKFLQILDWPCDRDPSLSNLLETKAPWD
jgi:uncharacterized protein (DUF1778 family)